MLRVIYGSNPKEMVISLMEAADIKNNIKKDSKIAIKPNLVVSKPSTSGATASPEIVEGIILYLKKNGFNNISIMESSWVGGNTKRAFNICGYDKLTKKYNVPLIDLKKDDTKTLEYAGMRIKICRKPLEADYLINVPVLKAHCQTKITCALKNLKGCIPDSEKRRFHTMGLHDPIAVLNKLLKTNLVIVDGIMGDLTFEEGGTPVRMNRVIMGSDPVMVDSYAAELLGYEKNDIAYITKAERLEVGTSHITDDSIIELNKDDSSHIFNSKNKTVEKLGRKVEQSQACSACYGSLIHALYRLNEKGSLSDIDKIYIGQGFKNKTCDGTGVGNCTRGFSNNLPGCPPKAKDIVKFIEDAMLAD